MTRTLPEGLVLLTLALPEGLDRDVLLNQVCDDCTDMEQARAAVRAMWVLMELPADLLGELDRLNAALLDPALVHGSARYASLRRELFELERRCGRRIREQDRQEGERRYLNFDQD